MAGSPTQPALAHAEGRVLWRLDRDNSHQPLLYVLTPLPFDFTHIAEEAGYPTLDPAFETLPYDRLLARITLGSEYVFRLTANPVHHGRGASQAEISHRFGHVTVKQQLDWLTSRAASHGFAIPASSVGKPEVVLRDRRTVRFRRNGSGQITLATATYEGRLQVSDVNLFRDSLTHGIGPGKAYGCGLLTLTAQATDL
jgi:CRISPR system Cascade subunit CasE